MNLNEIKVISKNIATATTANNIDTLFKAEKVENIPEGIHELDIEKTRIFSKGVELVGRNTDNKKLYKVVLWYDTITEGDYLKTHIQNLLQQVKDTGTDIDPARLVGGTVVIMAVKSTSGFLNIITNIAIIARTYREMHPNE